MMQTIDILSGTLQVIQGTPIGKKGHERYGGHYLDVFADENSKVALSELFLREVVENTTLAWYVDYFTEDPAMFRIFYLSVEPRLMWTNEVLEQRDPEDPASTMWSHEDVARWFFATDEKEEYAHTVKFTAGGDRHELVLRSKACTLDGADVTAAYCDQGVRGAMGPLVNTFEDLTSIEVFKVKKK